MKIETRIEQLEQREKFYLEAYEKLDQEIKGIWESLGGINAELAELKAIPGLYGAEWESPKVYSTVDNSKREHGIKVEEKTDQTLAEKIEDNFGWSSDGLAKEIGQIAENHYKTLLQSEYQRGYEEGRYQLMKNVKHNKPRKKT